MKKKNIKVGDTILINYITYTNKKKKLQNIYGTVIKLNGNINNNSKMITIRKVSKSIGIEITFNLNNPNIKNIDIIKKSKKIKKSKIYYLRKIKL